MNWKIKRPLSLFSLIIIVVSGIAGLMTMLAAAERHVCASGCGYTSVQTAVSTPST